MTIIAHIAAPATRDSIELAQHAEKLGVDAIAMVPGFYYGFNLPTDLFEEMLATGRITGVKNSSGSVQDIMRFRMAGGEDVAIFNGPDEGSRF